MIADEVHIRDVYNDFVLHAILDALRGGGPFAPRQQAAARSTASGQQGRGWLGGAAAGARRGGAWRMAERPFTRCSGFTRLWASTTTCDPTA